MPFNFNYFSLLHTIIIDDQPWPFSFLREFYLFIFDCPGSSLLCGFFSSCGKRELLSSCSAWASHCSGFSCCRGQARGHAGFSSFSTWAQELWLPGSRAQAQYLWCTGLVALQHVGSSWIRDRTQVWSDSFWATLSE